MILLALLLATVVGAVPYDPHLSLLRLTQQGTTVYATIEVEIPGDARGDFVWFSWTTGTKKGQRRLELNDAMVSHFFETFEWCEWMVGGHGSKFLKLGDESRVGHFHNDGDLDETTFWRKDVVVPGPHRAGDVLEVRVLRWGVQDVKAVTVR